MGTIATFFTSSTTLLIVGILIVVIFILCTGYKKASPDEALIISGLGKPRVLIGRAGIKIPFFEKMDEITLKLICLDVKTKDPVPTADKINVFVDSAVNVKIGKNHELIDKASQHFLNKSEDEIAEIVTQVLEGNIREIVCTMKLIELISDRKLFVERVNANVGPDLNNMGLELVSFNVQNFTDKEGVIEDLGIDNISQIKKDAAIAKANADAEVAIEKANANERANQARVRADEKIAEQNSQLEIKQAELKADVDVRKAQADAAYKIQQEEQRKVIEETTANANLMKQEKEIDLMKKQVEIEEQQLDAKIKKTAEAQKYREIQEADADLYKRQKKAEAELFEQQKEAESIKLSAEAELDKAKKIAEAVRVQGLAEAEAIKAKGLAEAEAIDKKALAMQKYGKAAIADMYFKVLPDVVKNAAKPIESIDKIIMYGENQSSKMVGGVLDTVTQVNEGMKESIGIDLQSVLSGILGAKIAGSNKEVSKNDTANANLQTAIDKKTENTNNIEKANLDSDTYSTGDKQDDLDEGEELAYNE